MKRPFSILDLQCDEKGNPVKSDLIVYVEELESRVEKAKGWNNRLGYSMSPQAFIEKRHELECILDGKEYDPE